MPSPPIVYAEKHPTCPSLGAVALWNKARPERAEGLYQLPMTKEPVRGFIGTRWLGLTSFMRRNPQAYFDGCTMPIELMAERGRETLALWSPN